MSRSPRVLAIFVLMSAFVATTAFGQTPTITFDENGNISSTGQQPSTGIGVEPISGISTLFYEFNFPFTSGDVALFEDTNHTILSDIVRFTGNQQRVYFFSEREPGETSFDLADVAVLPQLLEGAQLLTEVGPEGNNGAVYNAAPGLPGSPGVLVVYNIISDAVPEPSSMILAGLGGLALLACKRRR